MDQFASGSDVIGKLTTGIRGTEVLFHGFDEIIATFHEELAIYTSTHDIHKSRKGTLIVGSHRLSSLLAVPGWMKRIDLPPLP